MSVLAIIAALSLAGGEMPFVRVDFEAETNETVILDAEPREERFPASDFAIGGLLQGTPNPTENGTGLSPMFRVRSIAQIAQYPAQAFAKLFMLNENGDHTGTTCTAQFISRDLLITAAHCLYNPSSKTFNKGLEIAPGYDAGAMADDLPATAVTRAWIPAAAIAYFDSPTDTVCNDFAFVKIAEPLGDTLGWLGMRAAADAWYGNRPLHNFAYPHRTGSSKMKEVKADYLQRDLPEQQKTRIIDALDQSIARSMAVEPEFSPDDLYYQFVTADIVADQYFGWNQGYSLGGRSGSAYIDSDGFIAGVVSRNINGVSANCRITPELIGAVETLAGN